MQTFTRYLTATFLAATLAVAVCFLALVVGNSGLYLFNHPMFPFADMIGIFGVVLAGFLLLFGGVLCARVWILISRRNNA